MVSEKEPLRIFHLTVRRELTPGQRNQIFYESQAGELLEGAQWTTLAVHNGARVHPFERPIPWPFRPLLLRNLYGWLLLARVSREYDYVLLRHMPFDPFVFLFAPLIRNRLGVHHSKEVEELPLIRPGLVGETAAALERISGRFAIRRSVGILGVTGEIAKYEHDTRAPGKPYTSYPNGIDLDVVQVLDDHRRDEAIRIAFVCGTFNAWHGLDRLIDAVAAAPEEVVAGDFIIDLIGRLPDALRQRLEDLGERQRVFRVHGRLIGAAYRAALAEADIGLGSLALDRQNMQDGSTLKVREMLALGLPVYSGHRDSALPDSFPYYLARPAVDLGEINRFALQAKALSREQVRVAAEPYISKRNAMQNVADWLRQLPVRIRGGAART